MDVDVGASVDAPVDLGVYGCVVVAVDVHVDVGCTCSCKCTV